MKGEEETYLITMSNKVGSNICVFELMGFLCQQEAQKYSVQRWQRQVSVARSCENAATFLMHSIKRRSHS